jgi:hypothetical protein
MWWRQWREVGEAVGRIDLRRAKDPLLSAIGILRHSHPPSIAFLPVDAGGQNASFFAHKIGEFAG